MDCNFVLNSFPKDVVNNLVRAARSHGCKMFAVQFAATIIACMRLSPPSRADTVDGEHRVTKPYNPCNLLSHLSTNGHAKLVGASGFNVIDAVDLSRFMSCIHGGDRETLDAVWTLAREVQAQMSEQDAWQKDSARFAPTVMKALAEFIFNNPP